MRIRRDLPRKPPLKKPPEKRPVVLCRFYPRSKDITENGVEIRFPELPQAVQLLLRQIQASSEKEAAFKLLMKQIAEQTITPEALSEALFLGDGSHVDGRPRQELLWAAVQPELSPDLSENYRSAILEVLLIAGGNPDSVNVKLHCQSLLAHEAARGSVPTVKLLLDHGAYVNQADDRGVTPLNEVLDNWAHRESRLWKTDPAYQEIAQMLKAKGARRGIRGYFQAKRAYFDRTVLWQKLRETLGSLRFR